MVCACSCEWLIACHFSYSHIGASAHPSIPKVLQVKEHAPTPYTSVVFTLDSHLSLSKSLGVRHLLPCGLIFKLSQYHLSVKNHKSIFTLHLWTILKPYRDPPSLLCPWWLKDNFLWCCTRCVCIYHKGCGISHFMWAN